LLANDPDEPPDCSFISQTGIVEIHCLNSPARPKEDAL
jgi:hypothetical protein